ncbi:MAG: hypothetical protein IJZ30_02800 [Alphaproteobacteria bacterium]|nr:hypothetical protein [Alphaproteobacteria bacterium]
MAFERFENIGGIYVTKASISNRGVITLSQGACTQYKLNKDNAKYVQLYYDRERNLIGMIFVTEKDGAVANVRTRNTSLDFSAKSLLDFYGIMPQKTSLYEVSKADDGMIVIDMKTARERQTKDNNTITEEENS